MHACRSTLEDPTAPLSAAALRATPVDRHGVASAAVVVARMTGMLIGVAGLSAWGLHRFSELTADLITPLPFGISDEEFQRQLAGYQLAIDAALRTEYREIFLLTVVVSGLGAICALLLRRREPQERGGADERSGFRGSSGPCTAVRDAADSS